MARYWFARRFPVAEVQNNRMAPVSSEGWAVVALFAGCMVAGAVGLFLFSFAYRQPFIGVVTMAVFAIGGAAIGVVGALGLTRFLSSILYDVKATDPLTFSLAVATLLGVAFLASYLPARRATRIDPVRALRLE